MPKIYLQLNRTNSTEGISANQHKMEANQSENLK